MLPVGRTRLPRSARDTFEGGPLCYLAVLHGSRIHLTPVVYALDGGRLWVTTARTSVKAKAWRRNPLVAGLVRTGDRAVAFRGMARTYDALDPLSWPGAAVAGPRLVSAATRFTLRNARFFAGYAVDANKVPFTWSPPGRVFVSLRFVGGLVMDPDGGEAPWGEWPARRPRPGSRPAFAALHRAASLDGGIPGRVREAVGEAGEGGLGLAGERNELTVLPARWRRVEPQGAYHVVVPERLLRAAHVGERPSAALTADHASAWRAADMTGMLLQGNAEVFDPRQVERGRAALDRAIEGVAGPRADPQVLIRLRPDRLVWWEGWTSGTVTA
jgi:hypothetical protein